MLRITFISQRGERTTVEAAPGQTVLEVAHAHEIGLPGTCGASKICATCHVKIAADYRSKLPPPTEDEEDTLDLAFGVTEDSRLGCQITLTEAMDGMDILLAPTSPANL